MEKEIKKTSATTSRWWKGLFLAGLHPEGGVWATKKPAKAGVD